MLTTIVVMLVCSFILATIFTVRDFHTPFLWAAPDRISYCGRRYDRSPKTVHGTPRSFTLADTNTTWRMIGRTFAFRPIDATVIARPQDGVLCAGTLYVPALGAGNYAAYELSGGP